MLKPTLASGGLSIDLLEKKNPKFYNSHNFDLGVTKSVFCHMILYEQKCKQTNYSLQFICSLFSNSHTVSVFEWSFVNVITTQLFLVCFTPLTDHTDCNSALTRKRLNFFYSRSLVNHIMQLLLYFIFVK